MKTDSLVAKRSLNALPDFGRIQEPRSWEDLNGSFGSFLGTTSLLDLCTLSLAELPMLTEDEKLSVKGLSQLQVDLSYLKSRETIFQATGLNEGRHTRPSRTELPVDDWRRQLERGRSALNKIISNG